MTESSVEDPDEVESVEGSSSTPPQLRPIAHRQEGTMVGFYFGAKSD